MKESSLKLLFAGDFAPCRGYEEIVLRDGANVFHESSQLINNADVAFINLECPLTKSEDAVSKDGPNIKADPEAINSLKEFSLIGLANNHIMDFGLGGLTDTLSAIKNAGLASVGASAHASELANPYISKVRGRRIAIIALAEREFNHATRDGVGAAALDPISSYHQVLDAKTKADLVIVTIHGGNEYFEYPRPKYRQFCQFMIDVGASAVVCHHPHVPGAYEYYKGAPIFYSLGNVLFDSNSAPESWEEGYFVQINFDTVDLGLQGVEIFPYRQSVARSGVQLLDRLEAVPFLNRIESYRDILRDHDAWMDQWSQYLSAHASDYLTKQYFPFLFRGLFKVSRKIGMERFLMRAKDVPKKLNMIQCAAHRDALEALLYRRLKERRG